MQAVLISEILGPVDGPWIDPATPTLQIRLRLIPGQAGYELA